MAGVFWEVKERFSLKDDDSRVVRSAKHLISDKFSHGSQVLTFKFPPLLCGEVGKKHHKLIITSKQLTARFIHYYVKFVIDFDMFFDYETVNWSIMSITLKCWILLSKHCPFVAFCQSLIFLNECCLVFYIRSNFCTNPITGIKTLQKVSNHKTGKCWLKEKCSFLALFFFSFSSARETLASTRFETRRCFCWDIVCWCQVVHGNWKLINFTDLGVGRSLAMLPYFFSRAATILRAHWWILERWSTLQSQNTKLVHLHDIAKNTFARANNTLFTPTNAIASKSLQNSVNRSTSDWHSAVKNANRNNEKLISMFWWKAIKDAGAKTLCNTRWCVHWEIIRSRKCWKPFKSGEESGRPGSVASS